jgi:hypothetical protein
MTGWRGTPARALDLEAEWSHPRVTEALLDARAVYRVARVLCQE